MPEKQKSRSAAYWESLLFLLIPLGLCLSTCCYKYINYLFFIFIVSKVPTNNKRFWVVFYYCYPTTDFYFYCWPLAPMCFYFCCSLLLLDINADTVPTFEKIGRASCRERV